MQMLYRMDTVLVVFGFSTVIIEFIIMFMLRLLVWINRDLDCFLNLGDGWLGHLGCNQVWRVATYVSDHVCKAGRLFEYPTFIVCSAH